MFCTSSQSESAVGNLQAYNEASKANGFTHVKNFSSPNEINVYLDSRLPGQGGSAKLIVLFAHGVASRRGQTTGIHLGSEYRADRLPELRAPLEAIRRHLDPTGKFYLAGCAVGAGEDGTAFMVAVSRIVNNRKIIASETLIDQYRSLDRRGQSPGDIKISGRLATPHHFSMKWVYDQTVLKYGLEEQDRRNGRRCAYPGCPGHSRGTHQCRVNWHPMVEWARSGPTQSEVKPGKGFHVLRW